MKAGIYIRISDDREGREAGVERQEQDCRKLAQRLRWDVREVYSDNDISATSGKRRPAWEQLLKDLESGRVDAVLAYTSSRMYRRPANLIPLLDVVKARGIRIETVASGTIDLSTADGRMQAFILASIDQGEAERTGERVARQKLAAREAGILNGGGRRPYGYDRIPGGMKINKPEAAVIREIANRVLSGENLNRIVTDLNTRGPRVGAGGRWRATWAKRILCGSPNKKKRTTPLVAGGANWPAILTSDELALVCAKLSQRATKAMKGHREVQRYVLSSLIFCKDCGTKMRGSSGYYRCSTRDGGCGKVHINARQLEDALDRRIQQKRDAGEDRDPEPVRPIGDSEERTALLAELAEFEAAVERLADQLADATSETARRVVNRSIEKLEAKRAATETRLPALVPDETPRRGWDEMYRRLTSGEIDDWHERWVAGELSPVELADLHEMFAAYFEAIQIAPSGPRKGRARNAGIDLKRIKVRWAA